MIPRFKPYFNTDEIRALLNHKKYVVEEFEERFASIVNSKYAASFPSGRSGFFSLLKCLDISNSEIIIPAYTCIVVSPAILASNNTPRFIDVSLDDYNMKINDVSSVVSKKTGAVIPTYMYGYPLNIKKLRDIVGEDVYIIEDAAQAVLTKDVGRFGDAAFYSFNLEKQMFTFGGGMVTTNDGEIYEKLLHFRKNYFSKTSCRTKLRKIFLLLFTSLIFSDTVFRWTCTLYDLYWMLGWQIRHWDLDKVDLPVEEIYLSGDFLEMYSRVQAAVGISQLNKIKRNIESRIKISKVYYKKLKDTQNFTLSPIKNDASYSHYTLRTKNRRKFEHFMKNKGIQINKVFDYSIPHLPVHHQYVKNGETFPNSFIAGKNNINLPTYPSLLDQEDKIEKIITAVKEYDQCSDTFS
jgi:dTDP-4-amino-4,6-dideoxygalactose transaminase